ncbi:MAG: hypothetical protein KC613_10895, partial [Myxococcales bacterium]|nr:hypothetical protein [Myxococcales bacterium]
EGTGHVDLFLLPLDDHTVMVPQVMKADIKPLGELHNMALAEEARQHLDAVADRVTRMGLKVVRVPMLPPFLWTAADAEPFEDPPPRDAVYYSPANTLLVNLGKGRKLAFIPELADHAVPQGLKGMGRRYTRAAARALRKHGWNPIVVDATELGRWLGLFRCVTATVPKR